MPAATRLPIREMPIDAYQCVRCGGVRSANPSRPRPSVCRDCAGALRIQAALDALPAAVVEAFEEDRVTLEAALTLAAAPRHAQQRVADLLCALPTGEPVDLVALLRTTRRQLRTTRSRAA